MALLKKILIALAAIVALLLITALFVKKDYAVERTITINKPKAEVFEYLKSLKNQGLWSTWNLMDPNIKNEYRGTDKTVGFVAAWSGNENVGKGEQEIKKITEGERVDFELRFIEPMPGVSPAYLTTQAVSDTQTQVKWGMSGHMNYPMNIMQLVFDMDQMIGDEYAKSLQNLKKILENG